MASRIRLKMNALVDPDMITLLYRAARAGVRIELNIRGICCLVPNAEGTEDRIRVISIVGRFLEHSRIFHFENGGDPRVFLASAGLDAAQSESQPRGSDVSDSGSRITNIRSWKSWISSSKMITTPDYWTG